jgi:hypothetical protein
MRTINLTIPNPGDKVLVRDRDLLVSIFGDEVPEEPGKVFDMQMPEEHHLELRTGYGIRVTWDRLTSGVKIPKGKEIDLWTFDLSELRVVTK